MEKLPTAEITRALYDTLVYLGVLPASANGVRCHNVGGSDYAEHTIQPWSIWLDYKLNPFDADIVKRVLRKKQGENRADEYRKIIHICQERIRQIEAEGGEL